MTVARSCGWCDRGIPATHRSDSVYCSTRCRQAAHRAKVEQARRDRAATPMRLAYADPPYVGMSARYYRDQPTYAGEVDHAALFARLRTFDGWALSCSSDSIRELMALSVVDGRPVRLAIWHRRRPPHPSAPRLTHYEGVIYLPARDVVRGSDGPLSDVLLGVDAPRRPTLPGSVTGMKPPRFCTWLFDLLGAAPGDTLVDLFPGSGMVGRAWAAWSDASPLESGHG